MIEFFLVEDPFNNSATFSQSHPQSSLTDNIVIITNLMLIMTNITNMTIIMTIVITNQHYQHDVH